MSDRPKRKAIPLGVRLEACLLLLGLDPKAVQWDHSPSLGMRPVNEYGSDYDPPQLDPRHIVPLSTADHAVKTDGVPHRPLSGDKSLIAKTKRLERKRMSALDAERLIVRVLANPKPKRKIPSRPFQKRKKVKR